MGSPFNVHLKSPAWLGSRGGFSLVELVVVVVMSAIVAGIAIPMVNVARFRTDSAVLELYTTMQASQRMAVLRGHTVVVALDVDGNRYRIHSDLNNDGVLDGGEPVRWVPLGEGVAFGRGGADAYDGGSDQAEAHSFTRQQGDLPAFGFRRNGSATEEGVLYVTSGRSASSGAFPEESRLVTVSRATGRVSCLRFTGESWEEGC